MATFDEIAPALPIEVLSEEITRISSAGILAQQGVFDVYLAPAGAIPNILLEIGRLREITYRAVGVGSGKSRDLDRYDEYYDHLFLWDREGARIAGAYRIGRTDHILAETGFQGLYMASLCQVDERFLDYLNPSLEIGRSWIHPDYQRSLHSLLGLWKGIGRFVAHNPRYHKLFGAVSISDDYTLTSQNIIVHFLRKTKTDPLWTESMSALFPFQHKPEDLSDGVQNIEEVSARVALNEPDGKGVPVLLRQYLKLNATLLDFGYDPNFQNCLDAMILVDLKEAPQNLLKRFMGKENYASFASHTA